MKRIVAGVMIAGAVAGSVSPASAHRIDEYLQAATLLVSPAHLRIDLRLAPGIAVAATVLDSIDLDRDGALSTAEQRRYSLRVLRDLSVALDGEPIALSLDSSRFSSPAALRAGTGEIQLALEAPLAMRSGARHLTLENHHRSAISAYLVNGLVPDDPGIRLGAQARDYRQSAYSLEYDQQLGRAAVVGGSRDGAFGFWMLLGLGGVAAAVDAIRRRRARSR